MQVLVALDFSSHEIARRVTQSRVRDGGVDRLPPLSAMVTFSDWANLLPRHGQEPIYAVALLATEALVERHGAPAVMTISRSSPHRAIAWPISAAHSDRSSLISRQSSVVDWPIRLVLT